jgi:hypothetical protein
MFGVDAFAGSLSQYAGAINLASTAFNVFGALRRGREEGELADYEASKATEQARVEREVGAVRAARTRKIGERDIGTARAGYAGAGVDVSSGSAAYVAGEISSRIELDALTEILTGNRRGQALEISAAEKRRAGANARSDALWSAGGSLLGGFARHSQASKWGGGANSMPSKGGGWLDAGTVGFGNIG